MEILSEQITDRELCSVGALVCSHGRNGIGTRLPASILGVMGNPQSQVLKRG